jgi:hypothetical protein
MDQAEGKARALLDELVQRGGEPGAMVRAMANAPTLLRGYLDLTRAMSAPTSIVGSSSGSTWPCMSG